jgi:hypothetical protein
MLTTKNVKDIYFIYDLFNSALSGSGYIHIVQLCVSRCSSCAVEFEALLLVLEPLPYT